MQEEIAGVPTKVILQNYVRAHLGECQQCQEGQQNGATLVAITAHIFHDPFVKQLRVGLRDLVPIVRQELDQRPTYQQLLSLVRDYYFTNGGNQFWEEKQVLDERARTILEKLGEPAEQKEEGA